MDSKTYSFLITYTNINESEDVVNKYKGTMVFTKDVGVTNYILDTSPNNEAKKKDIADLLEVMDFLNKEYISKNETVEIKLTFKP